MTGRSKKFGPRVTVSLIGDDYDALTVLADKHEVSISWVVRRAVEEYLRRRRPGLERVPQSTNSKGAPAPDDAWSQEN